MPYLDPDDLAALEDLAARALDIVKAPRQGNAEVRQHLAHVVAAVKRLRNPPPATGARIAVREVCQFLMYRGEGLGYEELERKTGLPHDTFERLERAARTASDLDQIRNGISAALRQHKGRAARLLSEASTLGSRLDRQFANAPEAAPQPASGSSLGLDDACRVLERLFRYDGAAEIERVTGVSRDVIEQMRSASVFFAKLEGYGDF